MFASATSFWRELWSAPPLSKAFFANWVCGASLHSCRMWGSSRCLSITLATRRRYTQRLEREAKSVSKLSHPYICTLHDIGHQDGVDFLVMELLEGETLEQRLLRGPLPLDQALRYAGQIADALASAHRLGITHRDLKPSNVMLTKNGAKLMDFGLAKQKGPAALAAALTEMTLDQPKLTTEGTLVGTFQYMAPEQLEGKEADARTDIFGFALVLYEMVTGKPAFNARSRASLIASNHAGPAVDSAIVGTGGGEVPGEGSRRAMAERQRPGERVEVDRRWSVGLGSATDVSGCHWADWTRRWRPGRLGGVSPGGDSGCTVPHSLGAVCQQEESHGAIANCDRGGHIPSPDGGLCRATGGFA